MTSHNWFVVVDGREEGPLTVQQLREMANIGRLDRDSLIRRDDMAEARPAGSLLGDLPGEEEDEPFRPPQSSLTQGLPRRHQRRIPFQTVEGLARFLLLAFVLCAAADAVSLSAGFAQDAMLADLAAGVEFTDEELDTNDEFYAMTGIMQLIPFLLSSIVFLVWINRASKNLRAFGGPTPRFSSGWAVGYWFVPILNLFRPFLVVREIWERSAEAAGKPGASTATVGLWWMVWLIYCIAQRAFSASLRQAESQDQTELIAGLRFSTQIGIASDSASIVAAVLVFVVVLKITRWQETAGDSLDAD